MENRTPTPARLLEENFGGARELSAEQVSSVLTLASEEGILNPTAEYVEYRRPDLADAIAQALAQQE